MSYRPLAAAFLAALLAACGDPGAGGVPLPEVWEAPPNPHLADSAWAIYHHDSYAQHFSTRAGVEGRGAVTMANVPLDGLPVFVLFDPDEDILTVTRGLGGATLWKIDRETLTTVGSAELPVEGVFSGMYGFVDAAGRSVLGVQRSVVRYRSDAAAGLVLDAAADLGAVLAADDTLVAITMLYSGEIAFLSAAGTLGILPADLASPTLATLELGEAVSNGLSVDETGGLYIVTSQAMRRVDWDGAALVTRWSHPVEAPFTEPRPGRLGTGSGTTPALMLGEYAVIADDAESMNLLVLRRAADTGGAPREVCKLPAFDGPAATDNAIVVAGRTMIIEQNLEGERGVARFDLLDDGSCARIWVADVLAPTCVPTLSTASDLVYVYTVEDNEWALTGLSARDGRVVFRAPSGSGGLYDNYYSAVTIGPDRRIYVGTLGGLLVFSD